MIVGWDGLRAGVLFAHLVVEHARPGHTGKLPEEPYDRVNSYYRSVPL